MLQRPPMKTSSQQKTRAAEAELEDYKEVGGATSKAAQAPHPEVMEQLVSIQAVVKKAWNAQQNSQ